MERKVMCLFVMGLLMVASLIESEACKKCGNPMCNGFGMGGLGGHPLLGGLGGHPLLGGGFGGNPMMGVNPMMGGNPMMGVNPMMGGLGGQAGVGYPVPYPVAIPVPVASPYPTPYSSPYSSPYLELRSMGPIDGGYFEDDYMPRRRMCRCQLQGYRGPPRKQHVIEGRSRGDDC